MDERELFLDWWCAEVPEYLRESWKHSVGEVLDTKDASEKLACAWDTWQAARRIPPDMNTLIEEIADMVDHMGEGRRLEEYVGAIRAMKAAPTSDKGGA